MLVNFLGDSLTDVYALRASIGFVTREALLMGLVAVA